MYVLEDIVTDVLGPGRGYTVNRMYKCPYHDDSTASLSINLDTGLWHCFGCNERGNLGKLAHGLGTGDTRDLALRLAVRQAESSQDYTPPPLFNEQARGYARALASDAAGLDFWVHFCKSRGIRTQTAAQHKIGYDPEKKALTFPYFDTEGHCIGIKYRNGRGDKWSATGSRFDFFGPSVVGRSAVAICEGESDTLRLRSALRDEVAVVGTSGSPVSEAQWQPLSLQLLFTDRVWLVQDADDSGDQSAATAMRMLGIKALRCRPSRGKDLTEHLESGGNLDEIGLGDYTLHS